MEFFTELVLQFLCELLIQRVSEVLISLGLEELFDMAAKGRRSPFALRLVGYVLLGLVSGMISLVLFPRHFILSPFFRLANLAVTPFAVGLLSVGLQRFKAPPGDRKTKAAILAFLFALAMALVRYSLAK